MRLTRLAARDFMGFAQLDIDLSDIQSVVIVGKNGHGKSSLFDVLRFTLFGKGRFKSTREGGSPDQQVRDGTDEMWTCVEFETPAGQRVRVERTKGRGRTASIHVWVDEDDITVGTDFATGKATQHTNPETERDIEKLIGLPYDTITAGPWMAQEAASALMDSQSSDRMRMLVKLFEAEWCAPLHEAAKRDAAEAEAERASAAGEVTRLGAFIEREPELIASRDRGIALKRTVTDEMEATRALQREVERRIAAAKTRVDRHAALEAEEGRIAASVTRAEAEVARLQTIIDRAATFLAGPKPMLPDVPAPDTEALAAAEAQLTAARAAASRIDVQQREVTARTSEVARLREQRAILPTVPCHGEGEFATCRFLTSVPDHHEIERQVEALNAATAAAAEEKLVAAQVPELAATVSRIQGDTTAAKNAETNAAAAMRDWETQRAASLDARDIHGQTVAGLKDQIAGDRARIDALATERAGIAADFEAIAADEALDTQYGTTLADLAKRLEQIEPSLAQLDGQIAFIAQARTARDERIAAEAAARAEADTAKTLAAMFHITGIPTLIVENGLAAIEERANELLARLPQDFRIELRTQREKKGGGLMDTLDIVVTTNGWERDYEMLSVGQQFRVDIALRLALGSVLADRGGASIETLWLDEPLADLDDEGREAAVEVLTTLMADFPLVVVVSHHTDFNERFPATIEVVQDGGVSEARLIA